MRVLVTGATGNVGRQVVSSLAEAGEEVRAFVREPARVADSVEVMSGDLTSPQTLVPALREVDGVFLVWPGLPVHPGVIDAIAEHAGRVVYLSTEPATSFHQEIERLIEKSGLSWTFVRAIDFAANTLGWAGQVRQGVVRLPYGRASRSLIHERDVADVATHALTSPGHDGARYVITGPESLPQAELARIIGEAIGREVRWEELAVDAAREQLTAAWGSAEFAEARLKAWRSFVETPERVTDTVERLLGRPALTFRSWAEEHAADFNDVGRRRPRSR